MKNKNKPGDTPATVNMPTPPPPQQRHAPLPWSHPKSDRHDASIDARIRAILDSPSYRQADQDIDYLNTDATRGTRLLIDYQKAENLLTEHNIQHTIVVFGSTRITDEETAHASVEALNQQLAQTPDDVILQQRLKVARQLLIKSRYYDVARQFARLVSEASKTLQDGQLLIMTGGGPGIMEAANRGAFDAGSNNIGLNINLPHEQYPNPYITPELCFRFHYFAVRKLHFLLRTRALVVFPGGYGTFDELFETLTLMQTRKLRPMPVVLVGEAYWRKAFDVDFLVAEGVVDPEDRDLFWYAETADEIWDSICRWHRLNGTRLPCDCSED
ncbi:LOG family protein [Alteromonas sp. CYL-A6]|uniref:LOG family protein n=1 Tax=Alteromonas nitratireducens TaxID=3390813 RepID=UPI0034AE8A8B